ncbi:WD40/YVTN/BNR-like repeat-containing protein [Nocardioides mesophilus]|uniref:Exo-alpha-sialidase n=1 Tax=Nocardioides mesophilus TaxID=433659 RepID=A0A7G9R8X9_9ACTN|nr:exo-alpha-sialidase [Nocardioides mesophilus]QNN52054.1 exo-alpha-sialidase [Nocardioides mesophilus]
MTETVLMIGTRKGLWLARSADRVDWKLEGPDELRSEVHAVAFDRRADSPRMFMASRSWHWGPQLLRSDDLGRTWQRSDEGAIKFPEDTGASLEAVWSIAPSPADPDVVWAGTEPSALFRSTDRGESFTMVRSLWDHPHRPQWGAGFGGQAIHTLLPHPTDPDQLTVAMSTGGVYRTFDAGETWAPANVGIKAEFFPGEVQYPEFGQCVHKVARDADDPDRLYAQNHGGVYRSDDRGDSWTSIADGLPSDFGFPVVAHPRRGGTVFVLPLGGADARYPVDGDCRVYRSTDAGGSWQALGRGLPDDFYSAVMRDAMCADGGDPAGIYFGSRDGTVMASADEGESWRPVAEHLPDVLCVRAAEL